jgi:hypothetical protein
MAHLAATKGYRLVGVNRAGHNAFFVRNDLAGDVAEVTVGRAWRASRYRESRAPDGSLSYVTDHADRLALIADLPLVDVITGSQVLVRETAS